MSESKKSAQNTPTKEASKNGSADKEKEKALVDLGFLEEDDDFEEFPTENWKDQMENEEEQGPVNIWEDDWDDDNIEDDFSKQLKAELEKRTMNSTSASVRAK